MEEELESKTIQTVTATKEVKPGTPSTALEASTMDLVRDNGILNGLDIELDEVQVQNILSLTSALPNLEKIK